MFIIKIVVIIINTSKFMRLELSPFHIKQPTPYKSKIKEKGEGPAT